MDPAPSPLAPAASRVLLTGFEPFGGEPLNPSERLARELGGTEPLPGVRLFSAILPVDRVAFAPALRAALEAHRPDVVLALGQATGRPRVHLEARARNAIDFRGERDNGGHAASGEALVPGAPASLPATLPVAELAGRLASEGHPVEVSDDAGRHLCNALLYELLHRHPGLPAAFVHVPLMPEQAERRGRGEPSLPLEVSRACLLALFRPLREALQAGPAGA